MSEWRLWDGVEPPEFTRLDFFRTHPRIDPGDQVGHAERTAMVVEMVAAHLGKLPWVVDLGCGDGTFLAQLRDRLGLTSDEQEPWLKGVDAGEQNIAEAYKLGLDVERADLIDLVVERGEQFDHAVVTLNEVLEHLVDPHQLVASLRAGLLVCTSPLVEDGDWHYEHHAWAWDWQGYEDLLMAAGWEVLDHRQASASRPVRFPPSYVERVPVAQCIVARRGASDGVAAV